MWSRFTLPALLLFGLSGGARAQVLRPVEVMTTASVTLGNEGTLRILKSQGELSVEAWDRPEVEVVVRRFTERVDGKPADTAKRKLDTIRVREEKKSDHEVVLTTEIKSRDWLGNRGLEYMVRAPRDCRVVVEHGGGDVLISGFTGGIEARANTAEIVAMLPGSVGYAIHAKSDFGTVYSDFDGDRKHVFPFGSRLEAGSGDAGAKTVKIETRNGGISITKSPGR